MTVSQDQLKVLEDWNLRLESKLRTLSARVTQLETTVQEMGGTIDDLESNS